MTILRRRAQLEETGDWDSVVKIKGLIIWIHPEAANALTSVSQHLFCQSATGMYYPNSKC